MMARDRQAQEECSFLKKSGSHAATARTKKLLIIWNVLLKRRTTAEKSFLLLFFKKEALALIPTAPSAGFDG
jgi:hypothetical protein